jgi:hypothetical protein
LSRVSRKNKSDSYLAELDSHADQCCVGSTALVLNEHSKTVEVGPFLKSLGTVRNVKIVSAAITYDDPDSGHPIILIIHQALYFAEMEHILLCPMQLRMNQISVNERPKFLTTNPSLHDHSIIIDDNFMIPLSISGINSVFPFRTTSQAELDHAKRFELTSPEPEWEPQSDHFKQEEEKAGLLLDGYQNMYNRNIFVFALSATD